MHLLVQLALIAFVSLSVAAKMQTITVKGTVICQKKRIPAVQVKLFERDRFMPDDLMEEEISNSEGEFEISGQQNELGMIDPFITLEHTYRAKPMCRRISEYVVPQKHIDGIYDMTYVTLDIQSQIEREVC